jgi:T5SS/PEP-CTERM-associated repeat protein
MDSTNSAASINTTAWMAVGDGGVGKFHQVDGTVTVATDIVIGQNTPATGSGGEWILDSGTISAGGVFFVGSYGSGHFVQNGGNVGVTNFVSLGRVPNRTGVYDMSAGTFSTPVDFNVGDYGNGVLNQTGGSITAGDVNLGWQPNATGVATVNGATAEITANGVNGIYVGRNGTGVLNVMNGTVKTANAAGDMRIGRENQYNSKGTINQSGGLIDIADQTYVGMRRVGILNMSGGTYKAGDNMYIGFEATATGTVNQTGGTVQILGNEPNFTGNLFVGYNGSGTYNMDGGLLDMIVPATPTATYPLGTNNSASFSIANTATNPLALAQDGNLSIGSIAGTGLMKQTAGIVNVASNILLGAIGDDPDVAGNIGTLTITGGTMNVGVTSPTGGDIYIAATASASGTVNLQGGVLNVANGSGKIGRALGTAAFNFTGGTLKVKEYNASFGGSMGDLVQNGGTSFLDVTGNDTLINSVNYNLGAGMATIGNGRTLTAAGVINSAGAGVINVGQGGAAAALTVGTGTIGVDTLALNVGDVTASGGVTVETALTGNGTINGNTVMGASASVSPGLSAGKLTVNNDLTLGASGVLNIELGGLTPVTQYDQLAVANALAVGGTLQVTLINGFNPGAGATFDILDFLSLSGTFGTVNLPGGTWDQTALYTTGVLTLTAPGAGAGFGGAVPEPGSLVLLLMAGLGLCGRRRRS